MLSSTSHPKMLATKLLVLWVPCLCHHTLHGPVIVSTPQTATDIHVLPASACILSPPVLTPITYGFQIKHIWDQVTHDLLYSQPSSHIWGELCSPGSWATLSQTIYLNDSLWTVIASQGLRSGTGWEHLEFKMHSFVAVYSLCPVLGSTLVQVFMSRLCAHPIFSFPLCFPSPSHILLALLQLSHHILV